MGKQKGKNNTKEPENRHSTESWYTAPNILLRYFPGAVINSR
jgi:hypothetical protein